MKPLSNSLKAFVYGHESESLITLLIVMALILGAGVFISALLQLFLHEFGHLLFGLLTGYQLLSFRIFSFALIKQQGTWVIRKYKSRGSAGQCILLPPKKNKTPFILNALGGVILNAFSAAITVLFALSSLPISFLPRLLLLIFAFYGLGFSVINGIPFRSHSVINDGLVVRDLVKNALAVQCYYTQLRIAHELMEGATYKDIPCEFLPEDADLSNSMIGYKKILECYYYMDNGEWELASKSLSKFKYFPKQSMSIRNTVMLESLFLTIATKKKPIETYELSDRLKQLIKNGTFDFNIVRLRLAVEINHHKEKINYESVREELERLRKVYLYPGEATFCISLINQLLK